MGGDCCSEALEAHAATILGWVEETPDLFLSAIVARLAAGSIEIRRAGSAAFWPSAGQSRKAWWSRRNSRRKTSPSRAAWREPLGPAKLIFLTKAGLIPR